ncbi:hypothetical protein [Micromonospora sp. NPDC049175]|uniref:hypothetical protein n=1 Tax=unclassified Micromonospora TaxID=2617518 RepID=UPI003712DF63
MTSLRQAAGKYLRFEAPMTVRAVGADLGRPTGSTRQLLVQLDQTSSEWFSGSLLPSSVKGSAWLRLFSDGFYMFEGHVHENGAVAHSWSMVATPAFVDADGNAFVFSASGKVSDNESSDDFAEHGHDPRIAQYWDQLTNATVNFRLSVTMNVGQLIGNILKWIPLVILGAVVAGWVAFFGQPGKVHAYKDENGTVHMWKSRE